MADVRAGDIQQLGTLFVRHHARTHVLCYRLTGSRDAADDLAQQVFLRALKYPASFDGRASFRTWLYRIAVNECSDYRGRAATRGEAELPDSIAAEPSAPSADDRTDLVERGLARLSSDKREVLVLSRYDGLTYKEIGAVLGCSEGAARVRAHRALEELRDICRALDTERTRP